jgi:hypothetical protein
LGASLQVDGRTEAIDQQSPWSNPTAGAVSQSGCAFCDNHSVL